MVDIKNLSSRILESSKQGMNAARVHIQTAKEAVTSPEKRSEPTRKAVSTISQIPAELS